MTGAIVVTGGAKGIGRAIAEALLSDGKKVILADIAGAPQTADQLQNDRCYGVKCDVTSPDSINLALTKACEDFSSISGLVNNAGLYATLEPGSFLEQTAEDWHRVLDVNVVGTFNMCKAVVPLLRKNGGGSIVMIGSGVAFTGLPNLLHYVASKGAIVSMTRSLANELGDDGIRVNCIAPGFTISTGVEANRHKFEIVSKLAISTRAIKREQYPADITGAVTFLCSETSSFITGQTLVVDGGRHFH
ncbi:MAG: short-chain dehydrogenase [Rhizobiaceae bacterium MnEN-MB40S]|nr:MAG: short-chain dehydrogenase [Rhizobiaceae bacterium MnEN-MB40S]